MRRIPLRARRNLDERARQYGFDFYKTEAGPYWDETACYGFTLREIEDDIESPTNELAALCLELADRIVRDEQLLQRLSIPSLAWDLIAESWRRRDPSLYGRFDLAYDGRGPAKLLEYNADTPTSLFEAAVFQWVWLEDLIAEGRWPKPVDQFNSLHEKLIERLKGIVPGGRLHLTAMAGQAEDQAFLVYLDDCARQAGLYTVSLPVEQIGLSRNGVFVDRTEERIACLFKLYPWEWMFADAFGASPAMRKTRFVEPPWKAVLSNKGILPLLWRMAPGHPNLLPAWFEDEHEKAALGASFVKKPLYSREGSNVLLVEDEAVLAHQHGSYGAEGFVRQALAPLPCFDGRYPVLGSWLVGDEACGLGIRDDDTLITRDASRFVPHIIMD